MTDDIIGTTLGNYRIIKELGRGGMGVVYLAEHVDLQTKYALKVLPQELSGNREFVERFHREARVMANLRHQHIVRVVNFGHEDGTYFLVMDYVPGPAGEPLTLADFLHENQATLSEHDAQRLALQMCEALKYAHSYEGETTEGGRYKGVIHRDLKPANILLDHDLNIKVADFGLSKILGENYIQKQVEQSVVQSISLGIRLPDGSLADSKTHLDTSADFRKTTAGALLGTYDFMSPEQKRGGSVDARSDIYALGIVIYQILTGKKPLGAFKYPTEIKKKLSPVWDTVIKKCLQEDPADRLSSVKEIIGLLGKKTAKGKGALKMAAAIIVVLLGLFAAYHFAGDSLASLVGFHKSDGTEPPSVLTETEKPVPPLAPVITKGTVLILTTPPGAVIYTGDQQLGEALESGLRLEYEPGEYVFTAEKDGYYPEKAAAIVKTGEEIKLEITFKPLPGKIRVASAPPGAQVFLDEEEIGLTPYVSPDLTVAADTRHTVTLKKAGFREKTIEFTVEKGAEYDLGQIELVKAEGYLTLTTNPAEVRVYLPDNQLLGKTPIEKVSLAVGSYVLQLKKNEYESRDLEVDIKEGEDNSYSVTLVAEKTLKIRQLLQQANQLMAEKKYTTPIDNNAYDLYLRALKLDSSNDEAEKGIKRINTFYFNKGKTALAESNFDKARMYFQKCLAVAPGSSAVQKKLSEIDQLEKEHKEEEQIRGILTQALKKSFDGRYFDSSGNDAYSLFKKVLEVDPGNIEAKNGITNIYNYLFSQGESALVAGNFDAARKHFNNCSKVKPFSSDIRKKLQEVAQKEEEKSKVQLELKQRPGDINKYWIIMSGRSTVTSGTKSHDTSMDINMLMRWKVLKVFLDGKMNVAVTIAEGNSTINGEPVKLPNLGDTKVMEISRRGKILKVTPDDPNVDYKSMQVEFPDRAIGIGDSWTNTVTLGPEYPVPMEAKYTLKKFETIQGYECAVIESKIKVKPGHNTQNVSINVDATGRLCFAIKAGKMIRNEVNSLMNMDMPVKSPKRGAPTRVHMTMSMEMVMELKE